MINENGISNVLVDVDFLETEFTSLGKQQLHASFIELRQVSYQSPPWSLILTTVFF